MMGKRLQVASQWRTSGSELRRVGKFGIVGAVNTVLDFVIYNVLSGRVGLGLVQANIVSTTVAMVFSFFANKHVVFKHKHGSKVRQAVAFYLVTAFGLYVLQTATIALLTSIWLAPMNAMLGGFHSLGVTGHDSFLAKNIAKAVATIVSLVWNYIMYKRVVFK